MTKFMSFALAIMLLAGVGLFGGTAHAQVTSTTTTTSVYNTPGTVTTPGVPTTGAGGEAAVNALTLLASGAVIVGGVSYLFRRVAVSK